MKIMSLANNATANIRDLKTHMQGISENVGRLSSGRRLSLAVEDVAHMSMATSIMSQRVGTQSALINLAGATSMLQVMDDALKQMHDMLERMQSLAILAQNGALDTGERAYLSIEMQQLRQEIGRLAQETSFNGVPVFHDFTIRDPRATEAAVAPDNFDDLQIWYDASDSASVILQYSTNNIAGTTASGTVGGNIITTSADISSELAVGARIRIGGAGLTTTADIQGDDTYTISDIVGTTITVEESLSSSYVNSTIYRGLASVLIDKSGSENHAIQASDNAMPLWVDSGANGRAILQFDGVNDGLDLDLDFMAGGSHTAYFNVNSNALTNFYGAKNPGLGANSLHVGLRSGNAYRMNYWGNDTNAPITSAFNVGAYNLIEFEWIPLTSKTIHANGHLETQNFVNSIGGTPIGTIGPMSGGGTIFGNVVGQGFWGGRVSELFVFDDSLTADTRAVLNDYQSAKWDIGVEDQITGNVRVAKEVSIASAGYRVDRGADRGDIVGDIQEGAGLEDKAYRYTIHSGNTEHIFAIDQDTGIITINDAHALYTSDKAEHVLNIELAFGESDTLQEGKLSLDVHINIGATRFAFLIDDEQGETFTIDIDAVSDAALFDNARLDISTQESTQQAFQDIKDAIHIITGLRAQVGSAQARALIAMDATTTALHSQRQAHADIADTNVAHSSKDLAQFLVKHEISATVLAQHHQLKGSLIRNILDISESELDTTP